MDEKTDTVETAVLEKLYVNGKRPTTPKEALDELLERNRRLVEGYKNGKNVVLFSEEEKIGRDKLTWLAIQDPENKNGQRPFATVITCSDSRVSIDAAFRPYPGQIFAIENAGNVAGDETKASADYSSGHLHDVHVLMILGHTKCGAVTATLETVLEKKAVESAISAALEKIEPVVRAVIEEEIEKKFGKPWKDLVEADKDAGYKELKDAWTLVQKRLALVNTAAAKNAIEQARTLYLNVASVKEAVDEGRLWLVAALLDLDTYEVSVVGRITKE